MRAVHGDNIRPILNYCQNLLPTISCHNGNNKLWRGGTVELLRVRF